MGKYSGEGIINSGFFEEKITHKSAAKEHGEVEFEEGVSNELEEPVRQTWETPVEFLLSCIAMSVGLGNVWRFPFTAYENGGGAFLIPYIIVLFFIGMPLYYMELAMGQFSSYNSVKVWEMVPAFRGVGCGQFIVISCVVTYYVSLMSLTIFYMFSSFATVLPWSVCPSNASNCVDASTNTSLLEYRDSFSSAELYFNEEVLHIYPHGLDDGIFPPIWRLVLCLLLSWFILFLTLVKGVKSSGKTAYFTALFPYVVLFALLARGLTLPGAWKGVKYFITPQWEKLLEPTVWYEAGGQCFFSLGVGFGSLLMFSSYNNFRQNIYRDAIIISAADTLTSLLAGFTIFAVLGYSAELMGIDDINLVIKGGGSTLAFVSYPEVLARFNFLPQLFSVLFFLMLFTLGLGSASADSGTIVTIICDAFPSFKRSSVAFVVCSCGFLIGLLYVTPQGTYLLDLVDHYGGTFIIYVITFMEVIAVNWVYGYSNFKRDIEFMLGRRTGVYLAACWVFIIPALLSFILIYALTIQKPLTSGSYTFGETANAIGISISILAISMLPIMFLYAFYKNAKNSASYIEALKKCFQPTANWCPKDPTIRKEYRAFLDSETNIKLIGVVGLNSKPQDKAKNNQK